MSKLNKRKLDALIEEAIMDAYGDSEQRVGFYTMLEEHLALPFQTLVLGVSVSVTAIDMNDADEIVAVVRHDKDQLKVPILDLPLPEPPPAGSEWIAAYRHWLLGL